MRIGLSTRTLEPALRPTFDGLGVYSAALLRHLPEQNLDVKAYAWASGRDASRLQHSQPMPGNYRRQLAATLLSGGPALHLPVDLFHFTDYQVVRTRCPSVATVHDAIPFMYPEWVGGRLRSLKNWALRRTVAQADRYIAVSQHAVAEIMEFYRLPADRIDVVHCGIDEDWLQPHDPAELAKLRSQRQLPTQPYFLFVGTFQPRKNLDRVIDAHQALPEPLRQAHPLVIVGEPGWQCEHTVQRLQTLQAAGDPILWVRQVRDRQTLRAIYSGALALVFPSLYEGFGIPVLEAQASKVAVVTSTVSSLPEVAGDAALLIDPRRVDEIAHAMQQLAEDRDLRLALVSRGQRRVREFSWQRTAAALARIYRDMAATP